MNLREKRIKLFCIQYFAQMVDGKSSVRAERLKNIISKYGELKDFSISNRSAYFCLGDKILSMQVLNS